MRSSIMEYKNGRSIYHRGGRNAEAVMEWIYDRFPKLDLLLMTGCSAGSSAAPAIFAADASAHYKARGHPIDNKFVLMDSPSTMISDKFVKNGELSNWNPWTLMPIEYNGWNGTKFFAAVTEKLVSDNPDIRFGFFATKNDTTAKFFLQEN